MNEEILAHHTKLFDWFEQENLAKTDFISDPKNNYDHMTPIKVNAINSWRREVNKTCNKKTKSASHISNNRCHHSAPQERVTEDQKYQRIKSAPILQKSLQRKYRDEQNLGERMNKISLHYNAERKNMPIIEFSKTTNYPVEDSSRSVPVDSEFSDDDERIKNCDANVKTILKSNISMVSVSNNLLNYLTVDDCHVAARYKPHLSIIQNTKLKEIDILEEDESVWSDESVEIPMKISSGSSFTTLTTLLERDRLFRALLKKSKEKREQEKSDNLTSALKNGAIRCNTTNRNVTKSSQGLFSKDKDYSEGGPMFRRLNSALHKKMNKLVNAKKEKLHGMLL